MIPEEPLSSQVHKKINEMPPTELAHSGFNSDPSSTDEIKAKLRAWHSRVKTEKFRETEGQAQHHSTHGQLCIPTQHNSSQPLQTHNPDLVRSGTSSGVLLDSKSTSSPALFHPLTVGNGLNDSSGNVKKSIGDPPLGTPNFSGPLSLSEILRRKKTTQESGRKLSKAVSAEPSKLPAPSLHVALPHDEASLRGVSKRQMTSSDGQYVAFCTSNRTQPKQNISHITAPDKDTPAFSQTSTLGSLPAAPIMELSNENASTIVSAISLPPSVPTKAQFSSGSPLPSDTKGFASESDITRSSFSESISLSYSCNKQQKDIIQEVLSSKPGSHPLYTEAEDSLESTPKVLVEDSHISTVMEPKASDLQKYQKRSSPVTSSIVSDNEKSYLASNSLTESEYSDFSHQPYLNRSEVLPYSATSQTTFPFETISSNTEHSDQYQASTEIPHMSNNYAAAENDVSMNTKESNSFCATFESTKISEHSAFNKDELGLTHAMECLEMTSTASVTQKAGPCSNTCYKTINSVTNNCNFMDTVGSEYATLHPSVKSFFNVTGPQTFYNYLYVMKYISQQTTPEEFEWIQAALNQETPSSYQDSTSDLSTHHRSVPLTVVRSILKVLHSTLQECAFPPSSTVRLESQRQNEPDTSSTASDPIESRASVK